MKLSRREMIGTALLAAATPQAPAQENQDWLSVSIGQNKNNAEALAKVAVPQSVEPAFVFKP